VKQASGVIINAASLLIGGVMDIWTVRTNQMSSTVRSALKVKQQYD
jgi:hypothetical protein